MTNQSGVLPQGHDATDLVKTYAHEMELMSGDLNKDPSQMALHMTVPEAIRSPSDTSKVDLATSAFVDDVLEI